MRFSHAILLGSTVLPPTPNFVFIYLPKLRFKRRFPFVSLRLEKRGCALGMAEAAAGIRHGTYAQVWPFLLQEAACPCPCFKGSRWETWRLDGIVAHVFNKHVLGDCTWTLDDLARWIDPLEAKLHLKRRSRAPSPSLVPLRS